MSPSHPTGTPTLGQDHVVYLAVGGALVSARVSSLQGSRLVTRGLDGVSRVVNSARLYWGGIARARDDAALTVHWDRVQVLAGQCDLQLAWHLLADDGALEPLSAAGLAELIFGDDDPASVDAVALAMFQESKYFKLRKWRVHPASPESLEAAARAADEQERQERDLARAIVEITRLLEAGGGTPDPVYDEVTAQHVEALVDLAVHGHEAKQRDLAQALLRGIPISVKGGDVQRAFALLVRIGEFTPDENIFVRRAGLRRRFPREVIEAAESAASSSVDQGPAPRDRTGVLTVAIDDARTTEVDDAFAIEDGRLFVFIADVAAFVPAGGVLDEEVRKRTSTVYLAEGKIPMLPPAISEGAASLEQDEVRRALCFSGEMGRDGRLVGLEVEEALCRVDRRLTYVETDEILARKGGGSEVEGLVREAAHWLKLHRDRRALVGALLLQRNEVDLRVDEEGQVTVSPVNANGPARQMISEMMVAICAAVGTWCYDHQVPCVYRAQSSPDDAHGVEGGEVLDTMEQHRVLRRLKPSVLTTRPQSHYTLGVSGYTQVTSPLRRYQDLVMHQQLKSVLRRRRPMFTERDLMGIFESVDRGAGAVRRAASETHRFWMLRYLEQNPGIHWEALAIRAIGRGWLVELIDLVFTVTMTHGTPFVEGQDLVVEVREVDARWDHLSLRLVSAV